MTTCEPDNTNDPTSANNVDPGPLSNSPKRTPSGTTGGGRRLGKFGKRAPPGWPRLAQVMADNPPLAAFPRFRDLNTKSLLYYQCQLTLLRHELHVQEWKDAGRTGKHDWTREADWLVQNPDSKQMGLVTDIRALLQEYNAALLQYSQICALPEPETLNMRSLRRWLRDKKYGNRAVRGRYGLGDSWGVVTKDPDENAPGLVKSFFAVLWALIYKPKNAKEDKDGAKDLVCTNPERKVDGLTRWLAAEWTPWYREHCRCSAAEGDLENRQTIPPNLPERDTSSEEEEEEEEPEDLVEVRMTESLESWSDAPSLRITNGLATLFACLLPVIATCVLAQINGLRNLLLCLAGFTVIFTLGLIAVTQNTSTRIEIFAATATFSAVMVVFISPSPAYIVNFGTPTTVIPTGTVI